MSVKYLLRSIITVIAALQMMAGQSLVYKGNYKEWNNNITGLYLSQCIEFSPDGKNCYVGSFSGFTWYTVNDAAGTVAFSGNLEENTAAGGPAVLDGHGVVVSPDGKNVYTAIGYQRNTVAVYQRDPVTGKPSYDSKVTEGDGGITDMGYPYDVDITPDGKFLYVPCQASNSLLWFSRNTANGKIQYVSKLVDGVNGADGLATARNVDVSPDGRFLYLVASSDNAVSAYARDTVTGNLTRVSLIKQGEGGADCLEDAHWVEVSPDGKFVYVSSQLLGGISWFARNGQDGTLTYKGCTKGVAPGSRGLAMHPSGAWIFVCASWANQILWFARDPVTGALTKGGHVEDGVNGVDGLYYTRYNAISPKGNIFVATGYSENSFVYFEWKSPTAAVNGTSSTVPDELGLHQNFPNPFNPATTITYEVPKNAAGRRILLTVYDGLGRHVATLAEGFGTPGTHSVRFNALTDAGVPLASGVYHYRLDAGDIHRTRRMMLVR